MRVGTMVGLLATVAFAQQQYEQFVEQAEKAIKAGVIGRIPLDKATPMLVSKGEWARRICAAAAESTLKSGLRDPDTLKASAETVEAIGTQAAARHPDDPDAAWAKADALYFRLRVAVAVGDDTSTEDWLAMAAAYERHQELDENSGALERAVKRLKEGIRAEGVDAAALRKRQREIASRYMDVGDDEDAELPDAPVKRDPLSEELDEIEILANAGDYKTAKPRLLAFLEKPLDDTHYNDAVAIARAHKKFYLKKLEFRARKETLRGLITVQVPRGKRWKTKETSSVGEISQYDRRGELKRTFNLRYFKLNTWYVLGATKYDGSNVKGMTLISEKDVLDVVLEVKRRSRIAKRRMNRKIGLAQHFHIGGLARDGFVRFRVWVWKGNERDWLTYELTAVEWEDISDLDPEAEFVLDSLREVKYEEK